MRTSIVRRFLQSSRKSTYISKNKIKRNRVKAYQSGVLVKFIIDPKLIINYIIFLFFESLNALI